MFKLLKNKLKVIKSKAEDDLSDVFTEGIGKHISEGKIETFLEDLKIMLMESDIAYDVVEEIEKKVEEKILGKKIKFSGDVGIAVEKCLKDTIEEILNENSFNFDDFISNAEKPAVLMFVGVNGTGKTTTIAKIANKLQKEGYSCVIAASDTFRAGAIEQMTKHAERLGIKLIKHQSGGDPAAVAYDAVEHSKARKKGVVLIDTAGRMQTNKNLMDEMKKIKKVAKPSMVIFVGDALVGNDAIDQAMKFDEVIGIDAVILNKLDADAKGGSSISISYAIGKPLIFLGVGQEYKDLIPFDVKWLSDRIFKN